MYFYVSYVYVLSEHFWCIISDPWAPLKNSVCADGVSPQAKEELVGWSVGKKEGKEGRQEGRKNERTEGKERRNDGEKRKEGR